MGRLSTYFHYGRSTFNIFNVCSHGSQVLPVWLHDVYISWIPCFFIHNVNKRLVWQYARKARFRGEQSTFINGVRSSDDHLAFITETILLRVPSIQTACRKDQQYHGHCTFYAYRKFSLLLADYMLTATLSYSQISADSTPSSRTGETQVEDINTHGASGMQVEIPYVPAAQRLTTIARAKVEEKDTIVMVGQKKRKRVKGGGKAKVEGEDSPSPSVESGGKAREYRRPMRNKLPLISLRSRTYWTTIPMQRIRIGRRRGRRSKIKVCCERFVSIFLLTGRIGGAFYGDFPAPLKRTVS
jgi:hypothetical protein